MNEVTNKLLLLFAPMAVFLFTSAAGTSDQSLAAGCYKADENQCRIHVEPVEIQVDETVDERASELVLIATNVTTATSVELWRFTTDSDFTRKPVGDYSPAMPNADFPAECGATYEISVQTRGDTSTAQGSLLTTGTSGEFACPN